MEEENNQPIYNPAPLPTREARNRKSLLLVIIIGLIILGVLLFGGKQFLSSKTEPTPTPAPTSTPTPTETPTPTISGSPTPTPKSTTTPTPSKTTSNPVDKTTGLDRSKLTVEILNGSGVTGAAKKASDILSGLGYKIAGTGNADNSNYTGITIQVKSSNSDYLPLLKKDLSGTYTISDTSSNLSASVSADAKVIIGK